MDLCTNRDLGKRQAVSYSYLSLRSVHNGHTVCQSFRSKNVSFLAVCVADQCDVCASVRIILDTDNSCRNAVFSSLEVYDSIFLLSSAATVSYSDLALCVAACFSFLGIQEGFLRSCLCDLREIRTCHLSSGRCIWVISFDSHYFLSFRYCNYLLSCFYAYRLIGEVSSGDLQFAALGLKIPRQAPRTGPD